MCDTGRLCKCARLKVWIPIRVFRTFPFWPPTYLRWPPCFSFACRLFTLFVEVLCLDGSTNFGHFIWKRGSGGLREELQKGSWRNVSKLDKTREVCMHVPFAEPELVSRKKVFSKIAEVQVASGKTVLRPMEPCSTTYAGPFANPLTG